MRILLAEDDTRLGKLILHMLKKEGFQADWVQNGTEAYEYASEGIYDLLILDWMMPGEDGPVVCQRLRKQGFQQPIILLTARDEINDRIHGLDSGADDYLIKPFEFAELFARLRALLRRSHRPIKEDVVQFKNFSLNRINQQIESNGININLTPREFQIMDLLLQNRGQVLTRELIMDRIWGYDADISVNNLDAYIRLLRKKLAPLKNSRLIHNVRGIGYKLED